MKVTSIGLYSNGDEVVNLSFRDPGSVNPYVAKSILGLDADEIVPRFYGISNVSKSKYYSMTLSPKDIVLTILLNPSFSENKTYSDLRDDLYKGISSSRTGAVMLKFFNGATEVASVSGFITKAEAPHFEETPQVVLGIRCDDPMLRGPNSVTPQDGLNTRSSAHSIEDSLSTAPHGFKFGITFNADTPDFTIQDAETPEWTFKIVPGTISSVTGFKAGDKLHFSSDHTGRALYLVRGTVTTQLIDKIALGSMWPIIFPGHNNFVTSVAVNWDYVNYYPTYWGV